LADSIETGTVLESLSSLSDGRYRVALRSGSRTIERTYERILLTVPFSVLREIPLNVDLPPVKKLAINTLGYGTNSKLITGYREKVWRTRYGSTANVYTDLGFQNTWESSGVRQK
jgi:monoamine oxidase